ncbi:hypothetical protein Ancab_025868 [Ancistrocladus abbreviatus]
MLRHCDGHATTRTGCKNWSKGCRDGSMSPMINGPETATSTNDSAPVWRKLNGMASWFMHGVAQAFFISLVRCSCIHIDMDTDDQDQVLVSDEEILIENEGANDHLNETTVGIQMRES